MGKSKKLAKKILNLKNNSKTWSAEEKEHLRQLKRANIYVSTIYKDKELMNEFFPGRTFSAIDSQYRRSD